MENFVNSCYKLPWNENDNPNGWIEPTTYCQLACPGCYRGADKPNHKPVHSDYEEVKNQVNWMIKNRNVHTISIAGGEPLLYPQIIDLIKYCSEKKLRTMLYTNGVALDKDFLLKLKNAGLTQALVHVDRFQVRPDNEKGLTTSEKRYYFSKLFREVEGVQLGFIQPISADCFDELDNIVKFAGENIDIVSLIVFTLYRDVCWNSEIKTQINTEITINQVVGHLKYTDNFIPAAYLSSEKNNDDATWVFALKTGLPSVNTGYFSPIFYKKAQEKYRKIKGKYLFISRYTILKISSLIKFIFIKNNFRILINFLKNRKTKNYKYKHLFFQTFLLLRGPMKIENKWDLCQNCPDRIIYKGKLVPSCILEDLKDKENIEFKPVTFEK